jgi:hypothetical protein
MSKQPPVQPPPSGGAPPPPPPYQPPPAGGALVGVGQVQNQKALFSLILGIVSLICCGFLAGIPGAILGNMAKKEIEASGGAQSGAGLAQAGFILSLIGTILWLVVYLGYFLLVVLAIGSSTIHTSTY